MSAARSADAPALAAGVLDILTEVGNIGAGTAATALAQMTGARVDMGVPRAALLPVEDVPARVGGGDMPVAAILLDVLGDAPGRMLFMMPADGAHALVGMLMGAPAAEAPAADFDPIALSALQEVGNVLIGSYLTALSTLTGLRLEPTPPAVGVDMADALLGAAIAEVAEASPWALLVETAFHDDDRIQAQMGSLLYIPSPAALDVVLDRLVPGASH